MRMLDDPDKASLANDIATVLLVVLLFIALYVTTP